MVADVPTKTESLCSLVRSTAKLVAFSGMFTLVPVAEVSVTVLMSTMNDSRFVLGGGVIGVAAKVRLKVAVPPPQLTVQGGVFRAPLHETRGTADSKSSEIKTFRKFMVPQRRVWVPSLRRAKASTSQV